ncbi:MAG TPA: hypothetical protein VGB42_08420 [Candidatus Thermoplasmatota archaeon]
MAAVRATQPTGGSHATAKAREVEPSTGSRTRVQWVLGPAPAHRTTVSGRSNSRPLLAATCELADEPVQPPVSSHVRSKPTPVDVSWVTWSSWGSIATTPEARTDGAPAVTGPAVGGAGSAAGASPRPSGAVGERSRDVRRNSRRRAAEPTTTAASI